MLGKLKLWVQKSLEIRKVKKQMKTVRRGTLQLPWINLRKNITVNESAMADTEMTAAHVASYSHAYKIPEGLCNAELRFSGLTDGDAADAYVYLARKDDDIKLASIAAITAGTQLATSGKYYADIITVTERWFEDIHLSDADGNNGMATLTLDVLGYRTIIVIMVDTATYSWNVDISGFSQ